MDKKYKMKKEDFYLNWRFDDLKLFYKNYKSNEYFLNNFFETYNIIKNEYTITDIKSTKRNSR